MPSNILDRKAMDDIAEIRRRLDDGLPSLSRELSKLSSRQAVMSQKLDGLAVTVEQLPERCPHREEIARAANQASRVDKIEKAVEGNDGDISDLRAEQTRQGEAIRNIGGVNAIYTTIVGALAYFFKGES